MTEPHFGGKFKYYPLPDRLNCNIPFKPLAPNPFLPVDTHVHPSGSMIPSLLAPHIIFVRGDFPVCKGGINLRIHSR